MPKRRKTTKRRTYRKNPSRTRRVARRATRSAGATFRGMNFKKALANLPYFQAGMFGAKWLAKRFGGQALETDPATWGWQQYLQGALGAVGAGFLAQMIKPGSGQRVLEGGLNLMVYKMVQNELIADNEWATGQFGAYYEGEAGTYEPGDVEQDESGNTYMLGENYEWRALPEAEVSGYGALEPVGPLGQIEPVGPLGASDPYAAALLDA